MKLDNITSTSKEKESINKTWTNKKKPAATGDER